MKYANFWFKTIFFMVFIVVAPKLFCEGFVAGTLVQTKDGCVPIESLQVGDTVDCCDTMGACRTGNVTAKTSYETSKLVKLFFEHESIVCAIDQRFYLGVLLGWCKAQDVQAGDAIVIASGDYVIVHDVEIVDSAQLVYSITVEDCHNFYVSKYSLLAHNVIFIAAAPVAASAVVAAVIEVAAATSLIAGSLYSLWGMISKKNKNSSGAGGGGANGRCACGHYCDSGCNCGCLCGCGKNENQFQHFTKDAIEEGVRYAMTDAKNKHIFEKPMHNLDRLVIELGSQENVIRAVLTALSGKVPNDAVFEDIKLKIKGHDVYVRGRVMNGIPKIGTLFIK